MNTPKVTLDQWRTLQAVVDCGGFAQAAKYLHRSQSSVSYAVRRLQELLGVKLLHIEGRKAVLSKAGKVLLQRSRQLLADASAIEQQSHHLQQGWEVEIRLAVEVAYPKQMLMKALKQFVPVGKDTRIRLQETVLSGAEDLLLNRQVDLAISPIIPQGFLADELVEITFVAVAHHEHALHQLNRKITLDDLNRETQIVISDSGSKNVDAGWISDSRKWFVTNLDSASQLIENGLGYGWLPETEINTQVKKQNIHNVQLKALPLVEGIRQKAGVFLIYANPQEVGPATRLLADILIQVSKK